MPATALAFDRSPTSRYVDQDGRLRVPESVISRAEVSGYLGRELPDSVGLGLDPDRMYQMLRPAAELERACASFHGIPLLNRHVQVSASEPRRDAIIGTVLNPYFSDPFLKAELVFWDARAIERVEEMEARKAGQPLSAGYRFRPVMTPGVHQGQSFDGVMMDLVGNHVATVDEARVRGAFVGDGAPSVTLLQRAAKYAPGIAKVTVGPVYF